VPIAPGMIAELWERAGIDPAGAPDDTSGLLALLAARYDTLAPEARELTVALAGAHSLREARTRGPAAVEAWTALEALEAQRLALVAARAQPRRAGAVQDRSADDARIASRMHRIAGS
jgi:hypothetical protein